MVLVYLLSTLLLVFVSSMNSLRFRGICLINDCVDTWIQTGQIPIKYGPPAKEGGEPTVQTQGHKRESREFGGREFNLEHAIEGDVAMIRAHKADETGNCTFR